MMSLGIALVVLLAAGGTVAVSDAARPGDVLFPIDRAAEEVRLSFTSNAEAKADLRARFAEERVAEFEEIVAEEMEEAKATGNATTTLSAEGRTRVENALPVLEGFLSDAHVRASSTANARAVLQRVDARFTAALESLPSDLRLRLKNEVNGAAQLQADEAATMDLKVEEGEINVERNIDGSVRTSATSSTNGGATEGSTGVDVGVPGSVDLE